MTPEVYRHQGISLKFLNVWKEKFIYLLQLLFLTLIKGAILPELDLMESKI